MTRNRKYSYDADNPTTADRYYSETWKVRIAHEPTIGEALKTYVNRLGRVITTAEEDATAHIKWHTHQSGGECWMCVQIQMVNTIYNILASIEPELKKKYLFKQHNQQVILKPS